MYVPKLGSGDAPAEKGVSGDGANAGNEDAYEVVLKGAVPGVEGLTFAVGGAQLNKSAAETVAASDLDQQEGTINLNYAIGSLKVGAQKSVVDVQGTAENIFRTDYIGVSYAISDNLSVSYNWIESDKHRQGQAGAETVSQEFDSISLSYTAGGMTIGILDADVDNATYTSAREQSARAIQMTVAF